MSEGFTRTPTGIVGKWHFYPIPTIWVEGPTDIYFISPIVDDLPCRIEAFHGNGNATALIDGLRAHDFPYVVILDGDYDILKPSKPVHKRVIHLQRYSFENYLWEPEPINRACHRSAQSGERVDVVSTEFNRLTNHLHDTLREMVELDVASRRSDPSPKVLPDRVERLLVDPKKPDICPVKVAQISTPILSVLALEKVNTAKSDVASYLKDHRLTDLLKGHILFGVLRLLFTCTASSIKGKKVIVDDDALTQLLSDAVWKRSPTKTHKSLRSKLRRNVRNLLEFFPTAGK